MIGLLHIIHNYISTDLQLLTSILPRYPNLPEYLLAAQNLPTLSSFSVSSFICFKSSLSSSFFNRIDHISPNPRWQDKLFYGDHPAWFMSINVAYPFSSTCFTFPKILLLSGKAKYSSHVHVPLFIS